MKNLPFPLRRTITALRTTAALALSSCAGACPEPDRIDSVVQAMGIPDRHWVALTAETVKEFRGTHYSTRWGGSRGSMSPNHLETWAVPLVDPGGSIGGDGVVYAWLSHPSYEQRGADPQPWLDDLAARFDGKPQVLKLVHRAGTRQERATVSFRDSITDAEDRYGLTSHPLAPVFLFP